MLTGGWVATTSIFLITGFFVGWRRGRLIYRSQLPAPASGNVAERLLAALEQRTAPPEPPKLDARHPMVPFVVLFFQTWALWMVSGQIIYWGVKLTVALRDTDLEAVATHIVAYWWLVPVAFMVAGVVFVAWFYTRPRKDDTADEVEPGYLTPIPNQPPPPLPQQMPAASQPVVGWSLDPNAEHWAARPAGDA